SYEYKDAKHQRGGYGNLGYGTVIKRQRTVDHPGYWIETESNFYQTATTSYRLKDRLKREKITLEYNGARQLISDKRYRWKIRTYQDDIDASYNVVASPHYFPYIIESSEQS